MIRLFIDDLECDLAQGTDVAITKQAATAFNLDQRQTDFTNRFVLPFTPNNDSIMEMLRFNGNQSERPYRTTSARIQDWGITIADNLIAIISNTNTGYELRLLGSEFDFVKSMKANELFGDYLPDYTHSLNPSSWKLFQSATTALTYPVVSGAVRSISRLFIDQTPPAVYSNDIFQAIILQYFSGLSSDLFFKDDFLKDLTLLMNYQSKYLIELEQSIASISTPFVIDSVPYQYLLMDSLDKNDKLFLDNIMVLSPAITIYKPINDRKVNITVNAAITFDTNLASVKVQLRKKSGAITPTSADTVLAESQSTTGPGTDIVELVYDGDILKDEFVYLSLDLTAVGAFNGTVDSLTWTINVQEAAFFGDTFNPFIYLPEVTQYDYFQDIVKRFGLVYYIDAFNVFRCETFADIFAGAFGTDDWTDRLAIQKGTEYKYGSYAKKNYIQYKGERLNNLLTDYNGWALYTFDNDNLEDEKIMIESIGEALSVYYLNVIGLGTILINNYPDNVIPASPQYQLPKSTAFARAEVEPSVRDWDLYLLRDGFFTGDTGINILIGEDLNTAKIQELNSLSVNVLGDLMTSLERPQVFTMDMNLSVVDFYNLDFFKLKYFEQFQSYFYLIKAENFIPGKLTKCTFLKVQRA